MAREKAFASFLGCIAPNRYPQLELATNFVMKKLGYEIEDMERASCCPAPGVFRSFNKVDWMVAAARNICIAEKKDLDILTICNGCFGTLADVNKHLKADETARNLVNERLKDLGDYEFKGTIDVRHVAEVLAFEVSPAAIAPLLTRKLKARAAIHYGCHLLKPSAIKQLDNPEKPHMLEDLVAVLGVESVDFKDKHTCCGAGGGLKSFSAPDSMVILAEKMKNISAVKPDFILDTCPFCHLQFETGQDYLNKNFNTGYDIPVIHLAQIMAYCMGLDEKLVGIQYQLMGKNYSLASEAIVCD
nr:CoB--CoM heterodisulfide reductase subunit B [Candidatus Sigynarchaeota archaeon]